MKNVNVLALVVGAVVLALGIIIYRNWNTLFPSSAIGALGGGRKCKTSLDCEGAADKCNDKGQCVYGGQTPPATSRMGATGASQQLTNAQAEEIMQTEFAKRNAQRKNPSLLEKTRPCDAFDELVYKACIQTGRSNCANFAYENCTKGGGSMGALGIGPIVFPFGGGRRRTTPVPVPEPTPVP